ncbi:hypothetical protein [Bacillus massilinigeriensis]|uniref:hypothetical protein n=1 Tax=Bacillus mediterraneensis TaxID=1805474 RepID=UPI0008F8625E|nr:hypothetical protein [Bacillus mediterraneensis]
MLQQKLTIVPVTLHNENNVSYPSTASPSTTSHVCTIKKANVEISFSNAMDQHLIQTVMRELKHL